MLGTRTMPGGEGTERKSHRQGVGLYCKEALASRGRLKRKLPAGFIVDWAMVEGELELGSESN